MIESIDTKVNKNDSSKVLEKGVCRVCGCTWNNACSNPIYGPCSWTDDTETLCSDCVDDTELFCHICESTWSGGCTCIDPIYPGVVE